MLNIISLFRENAKTFYVIRQDGSKDVISLSARYVSLILISVIVALLSKASNDNILAGIITAQSILMGFAFNVMVYISSQDALKLDISGFREDKLKAKRLNDLADEIFYNLAYYIAISLLSVVFCLIWMTIRSDNTLYEFALRGAARISRPLIDSAFATANWTWRFLLFFATFESLLAFGRLVRRVTFHFRERRVLQKASSA